MPGSLLSFWRYIFWFSPELHSHIPYPFPIFAPLHSCYPIWRQKIRLQRAKFLLPVTLSLASEDPSFHSQCYSGTSVHTHCFSGFLLWTIFLTVYFKNRSVWQNSVFMCELCIRLKHNRICLSHTNTNAASLPETVEQMLKFMNWGTIVLAQWVSEWWTDKSHRAGLGMVHLCHRSGPCPPLP